MSALVLIGISIAALAYCYVLYPAIIAVAAKLAGLPSSVSEAYQPKVSIVLAVHNEEVVLRKCLDSMLAIDYPRANLEILVGSDGSSDHTNEILQEYGVLHPHVRVFLFAMRRGKISVVNDLVPEVTGEIILFTDADVTFPPNIVHAHVRNFEDLQVGGVAGTFQLAGSRDRGPLGAEQDYMSLEVRLRQNESALHSTIGIFGGNYSLRRGLWSPLPDDPICDELYSTLRIIRGGRRMVFDRDATAIEQFGRSMHDEFRRKMRFATRGFHTLRAFPDLLSPGSGLPSLMLWSHKALRWLTPFFLGLAVIGTAIGIVSSAKPWALYLGYVELLAAFVVIIGALAERYSLNIPLVRKAYWFFCMNLAFALGTLKFIIGREQRFWNQPTRSEGKVQRPPGVGSSEIDVGASHEP